MSWFNPQRGYSYGYNNDNNNGFTGFIDQRGQPRFDGGGYINYSRRGGRGAFAFVRNDVGRIRRILTLDFVWRRLRQGSR